MAALDFVEVTASFGNAPRMTMLSDVLQLRVRYSETDQMGTFYNSRALEWFECGRTELMRRRLGMTYAALEGRGVFLPLVEAHLEFQGERAMTICWKSPPQSKCPGGRSSGSRSRSITLRAASR